MEDMGTIRDDEYEDSTNQSRVCFFNLGKTSKFFIEVNVNNMVMMFLQK